ncbi:MAG: rod shape-determining protein MreD [Anaerolineae bacterium]|nr:rod shape-determining protein MreD [Anaerolineae bacterium]
MTFRRPDWTFYATLAGLAVTVLAQATLLSRIRVLGVRPDLLLVTAVCWSLLRGVGEGMLWGFGGGLGIDVISGLPLGMSALALLPAAWLGGLGRSTVLSPGTLLPVLLVLPGTLLRGWIVLALQTASGLSPDWIATTVHVIAPEAALNALLMIILYPFIRWWAVRSSSPATGL